MNSYNSIDDLIDALPKLVQEEWIYLNIDLWLSEPEKVKFYYIPWGYIQDLDDNDIYLDEEDMEMPKPVESENLKGWMLVNALSYIVKNKINLKEDNKWLIDEINYYRKYDTFRA
ncbi:TPA: hypothetical protein QFV83_001055 [Klebsiella aerogenes]|nr:hypothetical protein [Klebsiella aerogenes]